MANKPNVWASPRTVLFISFFLLLLLLFCVVSCSCFFIILLLFGKDFQYNFLLLKTGHFEYYTMTTLRVRFFPFEFCCCCSLCCYLFDCFYYYSEKALVTHSSVLAWKIPWREEPGRLQSMEPLRVGHD